MTKKKIQAAIQEISYDHIPKQYMVQPSSTRAVALNLKTGVKGLHTLMVLVIMLLIASKL